MPVELMESIGGANPTSSSADRLVAEEDAVLVAGAKTGDTRAFDLLVERHEGRIFSLAWRMTRNREDAEDVVQQSLQKAFLHLKKFEGESLFSTWLTRITRYLCCCARSADRVSFRSTIQSWVKKHYWRWRSLIHVRVPKITIHSESGSEFFPRP